MPSSWGTHQHAARVLDVVTLYVWHEDVLDGGCEHSGELADEDDLLAL
jgi:hypothetical protein